MQGQISLYELNQLIGESLSNQLPDYYWVVAEINHITENRQGHCYLELVEKATDSDQIVASSKAIIWANRYRFIRPYFEHTTGKPLSASMKLLLRVSVEFHAVYGLSLLVHDIDANYTLGDLQRKRQEIIDNLIQQGVFDMNKTLMLPEVIQSIAVISSSGAAGYGDFVNQLNDNIFGYRFTVTLYNAIMQGNQTEKSVIEAFNHIYNARKQPDVVVLIRGGGAKTDLAAFDSYDIAFHITQFPVPVFTGIGHERDDSIADMVSHSRFKTPTAVAASIVEHNRNYEEELNETYQSISGLSRNRLHDHFSLMNYLAFTLVSRSRDILSRASAVHDKLASATINSAGTAIARHYHLLDTLGQQMHTFVTVETLKARSALSALQTEFRNTPLRIVKQHSETLNHYEKNIEFSNPKTILKRGFSITRHNGKAVGSAASLLPGDIIQTEFSDGIVDSKVENNNSK
ncbi:MAG TPA: exodeoxyribonuclease VII large subunit [Bacteroidales bacterium]|nr:exodeoxyribonuclease VII large subunit [Bacteroidales bacterium]